MTAIRWLGLWFLAVQAVGGALWWCLLLGWPESRPLFMARGAPDATLLAFGLADAVLFIGTAAGAAHGLRARRPWARMLLCVHAGAAGYAALYCWTLTALTGGDGLLGAVLMSPSLVVPGLLLWGLRPEDHASC